MEGDKKCRSFHIEAFLTDRRLSFVNHLNDRLTPRSGLSTSNDKEKVIYANPEV